MSGWLLRATDLINQATSPLGRDLRLQPQEQHSIKQYYNLTRCEDTAGVTADFKVKTGAHEAALMLTAYSPTALRAVRFS